MEVHLYPSVSISLCSCRAMSRVRTKMMVWPSFSQLGNIISLSTRVLAVRSGHLGRGGGGHA